MTSLFRTWPALISVPGIAAFACGGPAPAPAAPVAEVALVASNTAPPASASPPADKPRAEPPPPESSIGNDPLAARGNMWGDAIGDALADGGFADDSGGRGEGIGLGRIGTLGNGGAQGGKVPTLRQGSTQVTGRLPTEVIQRIVRQNWGRFRLCYENGLRTNPKLQGTVKVEMVIDRSGSVSSAKDKGSDLPDSGVVGCVVRGFGNLSFPQPASGIVTVVYPLIMSPGQ